MIRTTGVAVCFSLLSACSAGGYTETDMPAMVQAACSEVAEVLGVYRFGHVERGIATVDHPRTGVPVEACRITVPEFDSGQQGDPLKTVSEALQIRHWGSAPEFTGTDVVAMRRAGVICLTRSTLGSGDGVPPLTVVSDCMFEEPS
jgi:hypothetical protein